jgi:hypothetical protein
MEYGLKFIYQKQKGSNCNFQRRRGKKIVSGNKPPYHNCHILHQQEEEVVTVLTT